MIRACKIRAYKVWYDTNHYIHKDTTSELDVTWTTDISKAKTVKTYAEAVRFFFDELRFNINPSRYDSLKLHREEF